MFGPKRFNDQDYEFLKQISVSSGNLFVDTEFPPQDLALTGVDRAPEVEWKRPLEITVAAGFYSPSFDSLVLTRGVCAPPNVTVICVSLTAHHHIFRNTVPDAKKQCWDTGCLDDFGRPTCSSCYAGIFKFRFWQAGEWIEVVIDDLLPTIDGKLIFTGELQNKFWPALLEKAYAKLLGGYAMVEKQSELEMWTDFTGGICTEQRFDSIPFPNTREGYSDLYRLIRQKTSSNNVLWARTKSDVAHESGLRKAAAYLVVEAKELDFSTGFFRSNKVEVVRLRNPWHLDGEWRGALGDSSPEVHQLNKQQRKRVGLVFNSEDEFYMKLGDFLSHFLILTVSSVSSADEQFCETMNSEFAFDQSAFFLNPQLLISARDTNGLTLLIQITQNGFISPLSIDRRTAQQSERSSLQVGVVVSKTDLNRKYRVHRFSEDERASIMKQKEIQSRSAVTSISLPRKGNYIVIPYLTKLSKVVDDLTNHDVFIRVYNVEKKSYACERLLDHQPWLFPRWIFCLRNEQLATRLTIKQAVIAHDDLNLKAMDSTVAFVVEAEVEGEKVESSVVSGSLEPQWNESMLFYRKRPAKEAIHLRVYLYRSLFPNWLIGETTVCNLVECPTSEILSELFRSQENKTAELLNAGEDKRQIKSTLTISVASSSDLSYF